MKNAVAIAEGRDSIFFQTAKIDKSKTSSILDNMIPCLSRLPSIFPGAPLKFNGMPGNIHGKLTALWLLQCLVIYPVVML